MSIFSGINNPGVEIFQFTEGEAATLAEIANLTPPGSDKILYYNTGTEAFEFLTIGTNLSITGGTLNASGGGGNTFGTIAVSGQSDVVADASNDTLTLIAGSNITITTDASTDTITITGSGGGSGLTQPQVLSRVSLRI